jgi:hypothetical protein
MAMGFAIALPSPAIGNAAADPVQLTRQPGPYGASTPPPLRAGEPAVEMGAPRSIVPIVRACIRPSRYQLVDALVTFAVMAWFTAALAWMVSDARGVSSAPVTETAATKDVPAALPQASTSPAISAHVRKRSI